MQLDHIQKAFLTEDHIQIFACVCTGVCLEGVMRHKTGPVGTAVLSRALTLGTLMGGVLDDEQRFSLQISGNGPLGKLVLDVDSVTVAGVRYLVSTEDVGEKGRDGIGANRRTGVMVGGGAGLGALIGAIAGGGKGAAIGAGVGAAAGAAGQVLTKGGEVRVPAETVLNFKLEQDLHLEPAR